LVADVNGDARDDLLLVNNNANPPTTISFNSPSKQGTFFSWHGRTASGDDTGVPNLLSHMSNGILGTTTITYRLARDYPNAIRPDWPDQCLGWDGAQRKVTYINGATCGRIDSRPRALVRRVVHDHGVARGGVTFKERMEYDCTNGRVYGGPINDRADLGFSLVVSANLDSGANTWSWYRQDKPFEGLLDTASFFAGGSTAHRRRYVYSQHGPINGVTAIELSDAFFCPFEAGAALPCRHQNMSYHSAYLLLVQSRDGSDDIADFHQLDFFERFRQLMLTSSSPRLDLAR
jgi:hypothetical protein